VDSGLWPLYRYDPRRVAAGEPPLLLDAHGGKASVREYMQNETRFRMVEKLDADRFRRLAIAAQTAAKRRMATYEHMAALRMPREEPPRAAEPAPVQPAPQPEPVAGA